MFVFTFVDVDADGGFLVNQEAVASARVFILAAVSITLGVVQPDDRRTLVQPSRTDGARRYGCVELYQVHPPDYYLVSGGELL